LHHLSKRDFVHCCFSDTGPVRGASASLAGVRETFTRADIATGPPERVGHRSWGVRI
jgi:hypothetical protein